EKPAVVIDLPLPPPPVDLPAFPSAVPTSPAADRPTAFIQSPRALPCVGSWLGIATESLECGRARFQRGDFEDAFKALENAVRKGTDRELLREARYWLGETLWRLDRTERAETMLRQFTQGGAHPLFPAGVLRLGWWALAAGHAPEAVAAFRAYSGSAEAEWAAAGLAQALLVTGDWAGARKT